MSSPITSLDEWEHDNIAFWWRSHHERGRPFRDDAQATRRKMSLLRDARFLSNCLRRGKAAEIVR